MLILFILPRRKKIILTFFSFQSFTELLRFASLIKSTFRNFFAELHEAPPLRLPERERQLLRPRAQTRGQIKGNQRNQGSVVGSRQRKWEGGTGAGGRVANAHR